jgi:hypothetical protein
MLLHYAPHDGEPKTFTFRPGELMSFEAEAIEEVGGDQWRSFAEFGDLFNLQNRRAWRAALWVMLRREDPKLAFNTLVFRLDEVTMEYEDEEIERIRQDVDGATFLSDKDRKEFEDTLSQVDKLRAEAASGKSETDAEPTDSG